MTFLKQITKKLKRFASYAHQDPERDWITLLTLSAITLAGIVAWNMWAFDTVAGGGVIGGQQSSTEQEFHQQTLSAIHDVFQSRAEEEAKYINGAYRFFDPSQ